MNNNQFVTAIGSIVGLDEGRYVRTEIGFIGSVKVPGIDIFGMRDSDRERAYIAYGNALASVIISHKMVFMSCKPDYSTQKANLASRELLQNNPERAEILRRMRASYEWLERNTTERMPFVMFFSDEKKKIDTSIDRFTECMSMNNIAPSLCYEEDLVKLFKGLLQGVVY
jgi:hypothetical protein